jgi:hypothetical protein
MRRGVIAAGALLAVAGLVNLAWRDEPQAAPASAPIAALPAASAAPPQPAPALASLPTRSGVADVAPVAAAPAASMVLDPRVPAIDPPASEPAPAQPWEIADPALYKAREKRLTQEMNERFVQAAQARLPAMQAAIERLRARGASESDIARAQDKLQHLQAVHDALVRGEPLVPDAPASAP